MRAVYHKGDFSELDVEWPVDLTGYTITLHVAVFGSATLFTKTTGFTILTGNPIPVPNLTVAWSTTPGAELDSLAPGEYVLLFNATRIGYPDLPFWGQLVMRENAPNFGYCEASDLMLGDIKLSSKTNKYDWINAATDEMNAEIGQRYVLPLPLDAIAAWAVLKLKTINAKLASGRLLLDQAGKSEDTALHAYGKMLVDDALAEIDRIRDGELPIPGAVIDPKGVRATAPTGANPDARSPIDFAEDYLMGRHCLPWWPPKRWTPGP